MNFLVDRIRAVLDAKVGASKYKRLLFTDHFSNFFINFLLKKNIKIAVIPNKIEGYAISPVAAYLDMASYKNNAPKTTMKPNACITSSTAISFIF